MNFYIELGLLIKEKRKERKWSQQHLADSILVSRQSIHDYEKGKVTMHFENFMRLFHVLEIQPKEISEMLERERARNTRARRIMQKPINW